MKLWGRKRKRLFEPVVLSKQQLLAAFRVPEDQPLLQAVLHVLKAQEEESMQMVQPGQPDIARRDVTTEAMVCRDLRTTLTDLVEKANASAKGVAEEDDDE